MRHEPSARPRAAAPRTETRAADWALFALAGVLAAVALVRLGLQAARGTFASDECFHAYVSEWLLVHRRLPTVLPELYSGLYYYYPPLLHVAGALWAGLLGLKALHLLPVVITGLTLAVVLLGAPRSVPPAARALAVLLCLLNGSFLQYGVKLYVEGLLTLVFAVFVARILELRRTARVRDAVVLGVVTGFGLLTKHYGWVLVAWLAAFALVYALRRERRMAMGLLVALGLGIAIAAPWLIRNQVLFGSAVYPGGAPDLDRALYALNRQRFSIPPSDFLLGVPRAFGPWLVAAVVAAFMRALFMRGRGLRKGLLALAVMGAIGTAFVPMAQARHLEPLVPVLALVAAWNVAEALERIPWLRLGAGAVLVAAVVVRLWALPDYRAEADLPADLRETFAAITPKVPADATILSLWTYDTFYYTRRATTWPNPWGQRVHPVDLFRDRDPDRFMADLDRYGIDDLLVPTVLRMDPFNSANYPESFVQCVRALVERGTLRVAWASGRMTLIERARPRPRR